MPKVSNMSCEIKQFETKHSLKTKQFETKHSLKTKQI